LDLRRAISPYKKKAMDFENLQYLYKDGVARITLNRPDRLNSFNEGMLLELAHALDLLEEEKEARLMVLTGAGRGFCAGADLSVGLPEGPGADIGLVLERHYNPLISRIRNLPLPVLALVNGVAAGAGASFALACDLVLAAHSAKFVLAFARIGLVPDAGLTYFLVERIGSARAAGLALLGGEIDAREAERVGLIYKSVEDAELTSVSDDLIARLASAPTKALALTKKALQAAHDQQLSSQLRMEREFQGQLGRGHDFKEGVDAFRNKRAPQFLGR
jgi:2-(1,2-epoxy-1,2-dihydrophenyl)acetyl-CoA isomerase